MKTSKFIDKIKRICEIHQGSALLNLIFVKINFSKHTEVSDEDVCLGLSYQAKLEKRLSV